MVWMETVANEMNKNNNKMQATEMGRRKSKWKWVRQLWAVMHLIFNSIIATCTHRHVTSETSRNWFDVRYVANANGWNSFFVHFVSVTSPNSQLTSRCIISKEEDDERMNGMNETTAETIKLHSKKLKFENKLNSHQKQIQFHDWYLCIVCPVHNGTAMERGMSFSIS